MDDARAESRWYLMLFPDEAETEMLVSRLHTLAASAAGVVITIPHVTIGYFQGTAAPEAVLRQLILLDEPAIPIQAAGLFSWSEQAHPQFGYTLSLHVDRSVALRRWQRAARSTLAPLALRPNFAWEAQEPHMHIVGQLAASPAETIARLDDRDFPLTFKATRLVVSQQVGTGFVTWLDRRLRVDV